MLSDISGRIDDFVVTNSRSGLVLRKRPSYRRPTSPGQAAAAGRMKGAAEAWLELSRAEAMAWNDYGARLRRQNPINGRAYTATGNNAFVKLAVKILQIDPEADLPRLPPASPFIGEDIVFDVTTEPGHLVFHASAPNTPGVVTELFAERLPNERRRPTGKLKSLGFVTFAGGSLSHAVEVEPGWYVPGYGFARAATGQTAGPLTVSVIQVP